MFSGSQGKKSTGSGQSIKKLKITASGTNSKSSGIQRLNSIPFSLSAFQESLSDNERKLLQLECEMMGKSWLKLLKDEIKKPYFINLKQFFPSNKKPLSKSQLPSAKNIYKWSDTPLGKIKVVIIGQDPYHGAGQAHGLCFSVPVGVGIPPSLRNIYAELKAEYPEFEPPKHGNLSSWANNGVLMLNTCLTVQANNAGSHSNKGWEQFTDKVIDVSDGPDNGVGRGVVFLAWGSWAAKRVAKLNKIKHLILTSAHPSPFSANKGFLGNGHFKEANRWLVQRYGSEGKVDWCTLQPQI
ncbi:uncharacterized protein LACBIDRAFT_249888 [Laccaria bicolor S238N-H82]|uniref:Uracil-DNA glycosylase n=1 Tax=Laccaria bicolor (strain S238N-H82 / ATCC MYA-4686) TaxID=486041 RepID=B0D9Z3_LACBS|nr:uncharacterized protein LACBIDRAFT_249888 [Laccaria bicolor S238N-H82]EDR08433.1 predicted protein [Laccaria bicolor S238N-H82]|eukprot:XP_001880658.1 predicted protein [Laccaria bicolor S238N-H82]